MFQFLTAAVEAKDGRLVVELRRRTEDFRGEPEVLGRADERYDAFLHGRVREALLTLGISIEEGEEHSRLTGLAAPLRCPDPEEART